MIYCPPITKSKWKFVFHPGSDLRVGGTSKENRMYARLQKWNRAHQLLS